MNSADRQDRADLDQLVKHLEQLSIDIAQKYQHAAVRQGCMTAVAHMQSLRLARDSGTAYSIITALRKCLAGEPGK